MRAVRSAARVRRAAALVAMLFLAGPADMAAADDAAADAGTGSLPPPYQVLLRSAVFPGWGQIENEQPLKAALFMTVQGGLVASGFIEVTTGRSGVRGFGSGA